MSDRFVEKSFLYLLVFSLLAHLGAFALLLYLPAGKPPPPKEPVFVDLQQIPETRLPPTPSQHEVRRKGERRVRVPREAAPRGTDLVDRGRRPASPAAPSRPFPTPSPVPSPAPRPGGEAGLEAPPSERSPVSGLLKPRAPAGKVPGKAQLFPGAGSMARLEESYRRKFEKDIAEGDTKFLNSDDIQFGSFLRRFENSVYGVWRYPAEAARNGVQGITPVRITFNRRGEVVHVDLLESSGAKVLDDEVLRTLKAIGPVGGFPRGYDKDEFHLIAFFQYGLTRRSLR